MKESVHPLESPDALKRVYPVLKELRTSLSWDDFVSIYEQAKERDHYRLVGIDNGGELIAIMGYRILNDFVHGKHLYIDDLVTTAKCRSSGMGATLLEFAEQEAKRLQCKGLRLCTGIENEGGKRFYERHGWQARALAYKKTL